MKRPFFLALTLILISSAAHAELRLEVDLSERELVAIVDGEIADRFTVAVGKKAYPTPEGSFSIRKVVWNPSWRPPNSKWARGKVARPPGHPKNPMKRVKIFFKQPDYYIHGTDEHDSLGRAASHGCVRMSEKDVERVARLVMEHGGEPKPEPWYRRVFQRATSQTVYLSKPVPIEIRGGSEEQARSDN